MILTIPLEGSNANEILVQLNGVKYRLQFKYNERNSLWTMDVTRDSDKFVLVYGISLVLGQELLEPYNFNIGQMLVVDLLERGSEARFDSFNVSNLLLWIG